MKCYRCGKECTSSPLCEECENSPLGMAYRGVLKDLNKAISEKENEMTEKE